MALLTASPSYQARRATYVWTVRFGSALVTSKPYRTKRGALDALYRHVEAAQDTAHRSGMTADAGHLLSVKGALASMGFRMGRDTLPHGRSGTYSAGISRRSPSGAIAV